MAMTKKEYFQYGQKEINYLKACDSLLGEVIDKIGLIKRPIITDPFQSLLKSVVGQQISSKAQATVWQRMQERFLPFDAETLAQASAEDIQACGMTMRKANYILGICEAVNSGDLDFTLFPQMTDQEIIEQLTKLKGIGLWTAEMLLIFSLQRPNVLSYGDLAICRGLRMLYGHEKINAKIFNKYKERYSPYNSVAGLYIWAIAGGALPYLKDPALK